METIIKGKAWKFGHDLCNDIDILAASYSLQHLAGGVPIEKLVPHVMEAVNPDFAKKVRKGDFVVAGRNYGFGKAHTEGTEILKILGVGAVIVDSIGRAILKTNTYFGLPVLTGEGISEKIKQDDQLEVNIETGEIKNLSTGETFRAKPAVPRGHSLFPILEAGGQVEYVKNKLATLKKT